MLAASLVALAGLTGCERPRDVAVRVSIPGPDSVETPVTGVGLVALPYNRDSVLAALEARAASPRPDTTALDSLFRAFQAPFVSYTASIQRTERLRDSLERLRVALDSMPRNAHRLSASRPNWSMQSSQVANGHWSKRQRPLRTTTLRAAATWPHAGSHRAMSSWA